MKRLYTSHLHDWYKSKDRKPLILRGARQVGKSTLVRIFAEKYGLDLVEINLEKVRFQSLESEIFDIDNWIAEIELIAKKPINKKSLIFLDEIQARPKAISFLRYFYEERPDYAVISAGSLLEIVLTQEEVSFPVGRVSFMWISPMTFSEFLIASGRDDLEKYIISKKDIPDFAHQHLNELAKQYFYVGGMPKAIETYINTKSYLKVREIHDEILETYYADFPKYERRAKINHLLAVFKKITAHLGKKIVYQHVDRDLKSVEIKKCIDLFIRANILLPSYHVDGNIPILAGVDYSVLKIYFLDIGLVNAIQQLSWEEFNDLFDRSFASKGYLAEQFIAQHLAYHQNIKKTPELFYWLRDKSRDKAEIDFILQRKGEVIPVEIKAAKGGRLKSLEVFSREKQCFNGYKFSADFFYQDKIKIDDNKFCRVDNMPYYSVEKFILNFGPVC